MSKRPFIFLGRTLSTDEDSGVYLEKNLLTFAGSRSGKGACHIIPNLLRWPHNALVIDPKGEAAEITAQTRLDQFSGTVAAIDPFSYASKLPDDFRAAFNPLDLVATSDDLYTLAEGLISRSANETQPHFNDAAEGAVAGLLAFILQDPTIEDADRNLGTLRHLVACLQHADLKAPTLKNMGKCHGFNGLAAQTAARLSPDNTEVQNILGTIDTQTRWLSSETIVKALSTTGFLDGRTFNLRDMKEGQMTLYLVIPPKKLASHGRFLRLFVRLMLSVMQDKTQAGDQLGQRCLFILDEFYSLGRLQEIVSASGQLPSSGVHLWPFVQSIGQLTELYGRDGLEIFTEDADALTVFGVRGVEICDYASRRIGVVKEDDIASEMSMIHWGRSTAAGVAAPRPPQVQQAAPVQPDQNGKTRPSQHIPGLLNAAGNWMEEDRYKRELEAFNQARSADAELAGQESLVRARLGTPYIPPDILRERIKKHEGETLPRQLLVFDASGHRFLRPRPWWEEDEPEDDLPSEPPTPRYNWRTSPSARALRVFGLFILLTLLAFLIMPNNADPDSKSGVIFMTLILSIFLEKRLRPSR